MPIDPIIARGGVPLDLTNTLQSIAEMRALDQKRNALIAQNQQELAYKQAEAERQQAEADAEDQAWNDGIAAFQSAQTDAERRQHLTTLARIDPQATSVIARQWDAQQKASAPAPSVQITQTPGPYGGTILSDGNRWQFVEQPRQPVRSSGGGGGGGGGGGRSGWGDGEGGGGPSGMSKEDFKNAASLRKEFSGLQAVKDYNNVLPTLISARNAPDDGAGDLAIIYAAGKILDPGSVVREGELTLTIGTGSPEERVQGFLNFVRGNGGRLPSGMRKKLLVMLNERALAYRNLHDQARGSFSNYAKAIGLDPSVVVGQHPADAMKGINPGVFGRQPVTERVNKYLEQGAR